MTGAEEKTPHLAVDTETGVTIGRISFPFCSRDNGYQDKYMWNICPVEAGIDSMQTATKPDRGFNPFLF